MYVMYGYEQFSGETCHLVYLELGFRFSNIVSKSNYAELAGCVAESEVSD